MTPEEERRHLTNQLAQYAHDVVEGWMRIVELDDVAGIGFQARARWQGDGTFVLGKSQNDEEYGRFRLRVSVEDLGPVPPIGPENDLGVYGITDDRAGEPVSAGQEEQLERWGREMAEEPQWVLRTWADVVTGDEVRMPGTDQTTTIVMRYRHPSEDPTGQSWHVVAGQGGHWNDHIVQPGECVVSLRLADQTPRFMNPASPVEILLSPTEVSRIELLGWGYRQRTHI